MKRIEYVLLQAAIALAGVMLCIVAAFLCLRFVFGGRFSFSGLLAFGKEYGWIYTPAILLMFAGHRITQGLTHVHRLWVLAVIAFAISYICHSVFSLFTWYWSITLVIVVAMVLTGWAILAAWIRRHIDKIEMFGNQ